MNSDPFRERQNSMKTYDKQHFFFPQHYYEYVGADCHVATAAVTAD